MTRVVSAQHIADEIGGLLTECASVLRPDVYDALKAARQRERSERGRMVLDQLIKNADIARRDDVPLCQDTGTVWVRLEVGPNIALEGDIVSAINDTVAEVYLSQGLRMSLVYDALFDRRNTNANTPAFIEIAPVSRDGVTAQVMMKGAGSDNASRLIMLSPDAGVEGVKRELVALVEEKASMACPPLIIGVGIGSTFDKCAGLAKRALLKPLNETAADARVAALERELLEAVNATGMGPGGLGGDVTALGVSVLTAPCHIAALPVAINMGCSAMRSRVARLI